MYILKRRFKNDEYILDWTVVTTGNECRGHTWKNQYFSETQQCVDYIRTRSDCNQRYTIHALRGDGNCGCVDVGIDCKVQANWHAHSIVDIIELVVTPGNLMTNFLTFIHNR